MNLPDLNSDLADTYLLARHRNMQLPHVDSNSAEAQLVEGLRNIRLTGPDSSSVQVPTSTNMQPFVRWGDLDRRIPSSASQHSLSARNLVKILELTLESLTPQRPFSDQLPRPSLWSETRAVMANLRNTYGGWSTIVTTRPNSILEALLDNAYATKTVDGMTFKEIRMPPVWKNFLKAWFTRTVNFWTERKCQSGEAWHAGVHQHDDRKMYYNVNEGEGEEMQQRMRELEVKMEEAEIS